VIPAQFSRTALRVAMRRAAHQLMDRPPVLVDPVAVPILGRENAAALQADPAAIERGPLSAYLRAFFAVRSRFAEDHLAAARAAGISQFVVLGAGLDTFAYRDPSPELPLRVWEVDYPATQEWKRQLLADAGIPIPPTLTFVPLDFEHDTLPHALAGAGFDTAAGAVFSWLGVVPYLTRTAIMDTLRFVASATRAGGGIAFDYGISPDTLTLTQRAVFYAMAARVRAAGEPWQTFFDPDELRRDLLALGFAMAEDVPPEVINARYFAGREDGLRVGGIGHLFWAGAAVPSGQREIPPPVTA
jgi:methyltransferase (TIGR00027 family)